MNVQYVVSYERALLHTGEVGGGSARSCLTAYRLTGRKGQVFGVVKVEALRLAGVFGPGSPLQCRFLDVHNDTYPDVGVSSPAIKIFPGNGHMI